jgi:hypothetical protein
MIKRKPNKKTLFAIAILVFILIAAWASSEMRGVNPGLTQEERIYLLKQSEEFKSYSEENCVKLSEQACLQKYWKSHWKEK